MSLKIAAVRIARFALSVAYLPFRLLPRREKIVVISRQSDEPTPDLTMVVAAIQARESHVPVVVLTRRLHGGLAGGVKYALHMFRQMWHVATARVVVLDSYCIVVSALNHSAGLTVIQMWHALGALKKFGYSSLDIPGGRSSAVAKTMRMHAGYDVVLVSSKAATASFAEAFQTRLDRVQVAPLPRVDSLRDEPTKAHDRARIIAQFPELVAENVVLYAPTLDRTEHESGSSAVVSLEDLATQLEAAGFIPVIKPHPLANTPLPSGQERYRAASTSEFFTVASAFVTDYSSAVFEAGIAGIPVFFLIPPEGGEASPHLYIDLHAEVPECVVASIPELVTRLGRDDESAKASAQFISRFVEVDPERSATDGVAEIVVGHLR